MRVEALGVMVLALGIAVSAQTRPPASPQGRGGRPPATQPSPAARANPDTDPRAATARQLCGVCHPFETVVTIRRTRSQWEATVENMISRGARGTSAELATAIDFLAERYGLNAPPNRGGAGPPHQPLLGAQAAQKGRPL